MLIATLILGVVFALAFMALFPGWPEVAKMALSTDLALALATVLAIREIRMPWREALSVRLFDRRIVLPLILVLVGSLTVFSELYVVIQRIAPVPDSFQTALRELLELDGPVDTIVTLSIAIGFAPLFEEALFRGVLLRGLVRTRGPRSASLWTAAFFALFHLYNPWQLLPTFFLGLVLAWLVLTTGSIWTSVLLHALFNAVSLAVFKLPMDDMATDATGVPWEGLVIIVGLLVGSFALLIGLAWIERVTGGGLFSEPPAPGKPELEARYVTDVGTTSPPVP